MNQPTETIRHVVIMWNDLIVGALRAAARLVFTLAVFGGCTYLVFWRAESGWLYVPALALMIFRRGL